MSFLSVLTGSFATPAAENPTVAMVEAAYRHHGLDARYLNCDVAPAALGDAVRGARAMGWAGFNCSLPHKVAVIEHLDGLADSAAVIGAVNCAVLRDGRYVGENTDGQGFLASLRMVADPAGSSLVVLGAGGAARAIAVEAALAGAAPITIVNRGAERGAELVELLRTRTPADARLAPWDGDVRRAAGHRHRRQRHLSRAVPRRRRTPGSRPGQPAPGPGRRRRHPQPAAHAPPARRRGPRLHGPRRAGHAGGPGRDRRSATGRAWTPTRAVMRRTLEEIFSG